MRKKQKLGSGKRFKKMEDSLEKKGYSEESAKKITAAAGIKKYGKKKMMSMAKAGKARKKK